MKATIIYLFLIFLQTSTSASDHLFKVFYIKGDALIEHDSKSNALAKDAMIYINDIITLKENTTMVLLDENNNSLVIEKPGTYSTDEIILLFENVNHDNFTQKYFSYVVEEFLHHHGEKTYTAAVSRGELIELLNPKDSCIVISDDIDFNWTNLENKDLWFFIYSSSGQRIHESQAKDTSLIISIKGSGLISGETYLWMVSLNRYPTEDDLLNVFTIADDINKLKLESDIKNFETQLSNSGYDAKNETSRLLLYGFYIENKLFNEAIRIKEALVKNNPDIALLIK